MRIMLSGSLLLVLLWPAMVAAGNAGSDYGLGEPEPLDSHVAAAPEPPVAALVESATPMAALAAPEAAAPPPFRIRLTGTQALAARDATPLTAGLRYHPANH